MAFKRIRDDSVGTTTIEALFLDLRGRKVGNAWGHQIDLWRTYEASAVQSGDVAIQLPTGSGKTLVGLLIAEWRRRKFGERVVYLCPTRQLANQVASQAKDNFGIEVALLAGKKTDFDPQVSGAYLNAERVAIAAYSGLFNVNPFFADPNLVICDDAHAAEQYVASHWCLDVDATEDAALHRAMSVTLNAFLDPLNRTRLSGEANSDLDLNWCDKLATPQWLSIASEMMAVVDQNVGNSNLRFPWSQIREHLDACHVYMGHGRILIRPFIPPTETHEAFAGAKQRIYMSATLGLGGELERIFGRRSIKRLPIPKGWDKQGIGRRLYFFPERTLDAEKATALTLSMMREAGRSVVLTPDTKRAKHVTEVVQSQLGFEVFQAKALEASKEPFTRTAKAVVVAANRYEGIDFPGDESHLLVVIGLPRATHLQERFLIDRMGASAMFNERILTRVIQAFGRCTRGATDYAAVVVQGQELYRYLMKRENRSPLDPEMQAELEFGIRQGDGPDAASAEETLDNLRMFLEQGDEWHDIDSDILNLRSKMTQTPFPGIGELQASVPHEIDYLYAMWSGNLDAARAACDDVLAVLKDPAMKGFRAWWNYCAGSTCWAISEKGRPAFEKFARRYFTQAVFDARFVSWLSDLTVVYGNEESAQANSPELTRMLERMEDRFIEIGTANLSKFTAEETAILKGLATGDAAAFEDAQRRLGLLLGFDAGNSDEQGAPDPWWCLAPDKCIVFEDHSDAKTTSSLDAKKARQVALHPNWVRAKGIAGADCHVRNVLVTPVQKADHAAKAHLQDFYVWPIDDFRSWARDALTKIRELRRNFTDRADLAWRAEAAAALEDAGLTPEAIWTTASQTTGTEALS